MWNFNKVVKLESRPGYSYLVVFDDGTRGVVDLREYLGNGPVFGPLRDPAFFKRAYIAGGTIAWPNEADNAPETLYEKCQAADPEGSVKAMPTISMFYGIIIRLYFAPGEHNPPHFHAYYNEFKASVDIRTGDVIEGSLPPRQRKLVQAWTELHQDELMADWNLVMNGDEPFKIQPLQ